MKFKTHYNQKDFPHKLEPGGGKTMVETAGYIPAKQRIENLILAGQRLVSSRAEQYDFTETEINEDFDDPTRRKNYDMADAFQDAHQVNLRLKRSKKEKEAAAAYAKKEEQEKADQAKKDATPPPK